MQKRITAQFDSIDEAERASARLRSAIGGIRAEYRAVRPDAAPTSSPYTASLYVPWHPGIPEDALNLQSSHLGSRVLLTSDLMGLPAYRAQETALTVTLDPDMAARASALLCNSGGRRIREHF